MAFRLFQIQNWSGSFEFAPPLVEKAVNLDEVSTVQQCDSRGAGPWVRVRMKNGEVFIAQGSPKDFCS